MRVRRSILRLLSCLVFCLLASRVHGQQFVDATDRLVVDDPGATPFAIWGVSIVDVNQDGLADIYHSGRLFLADGTGGFRDVRAAAGIEPEGGAVFGGIWADYDGDGRLDLFVEDLAQGSKLFHNRGAFHFAERNEGANVITDDLIAQGAVWADFDGDGWLDLFAAGDDGKSKYWRNMGGSLFEDRTHRGLHYERNLYGAAAADYDRDGDLDLFIAACNSDPARSLNVMLRNDGGSFTDVTGVAGLWHDGAAWGTVWFDYDNDGWEDLFVANMPSTEGRAGQDLLYRNRGDGTFEEVAEAAGVAGLAGQQRSWDPTVGDVDNDGWLDLYVSAEPDDHRSGTVMSRLYMNNGDGTFRDVHGTTPMHAQGASASTLGDIDADGDVDLVLGTRAGVAARAHLYLNEGNDNHWLGVHLRDRSGNRHGIGSRVELWRAGGAQVWTISGGDGMTSQSANLSAHFGLGSDADLAARPIDSLVVRWPTGDVDRVDEFTPDRYITIERGRGTVVPVRAASGLRERLVGGYDGVLRLEWDAGGGGVDYNVEIRAPEGVFIQRTDETWAEFDVQELGLGPGDEAWWIVVADDGLMQRASLGLPRVIDGTAITAETLPERAALAVELYPNPFRERVRARIEADPLASVRAAVYDVLGRRVRTLATGDRGPNTLEWDGRDDAGRRVGAGAYVLRVEAGEERTAMLVTRLR